MKRYDLMKSTREIKASDVSKGKVAMTNGCTLNTNGDIFADLLESFNTIDDARAALDEFDSSIEYYSSAVPFYYVTEYYIEEVEIDEEDGEEIGSYGIVAFAVGLEYTI